MTVSSRRRGQLRIGIGRAPAPRKGRRTASAASFKAARSFVDGPWRLLGIHLYYLLRRGQYAVRPTDSTTLAKIRRAFFGRFRRILIGLQTPEAAEPMLATQNPLDVLGVTIATGDEPELPKTTDELTGLPTGTALDALFAHAASEAEAGGARFPVLSLSVDRLDGINEVFGHEAGDAALRELAGRLAAAGHLGCAAYSSANRFILIGRPGHDPDGLRTAIAALLEAPFRFDTERRQIGVSVGMAIYPEHGSDLEMVLHAANFARRCAKSAGGNTIILCDPARCDEQRARFQLQTELRHAIADGQLRLYYQPKVLMPRSQLVGFEALIRWQHPVNGLLGPGAFLDIAEEANLMQAITRWAFRTAARQTREWIAQGLVPVPIAVNTPPGEFVERLLSDHLPAYEAAGVPPGLIEIEITESKVIDNKAGFKEVGEALKARGIKIAMDDFGTGYSCLSGLSSLPITTLKIDQSFTQQLAEDSGSRAVAAAIVSIARELDMDLVAEGVETREQLRILTSMGCNVVQGYLTGRPCPADDAGRLLSRVPQRYFRPAPVAAAPAG